MKPENWWHDFFSGVVADFWLRATTEEQTRAEVDFLIQAIGPGPGARILDVPCGGGRHALELAARGYDVTGVDWSHDFLASARAQSARRGLAVNWQQHEMRDLPWHDAFDGAFSFGNSFGYLDDNGNADFLKAVARTLKLKARFALDTGMVAESLFFTFQERRSLPVGDILFESLGRYDHVHGRLETDYTFTRGGQSDTRHASTRVYTYRELLGLFHDAGFSDCIGYGSLQAEPYRLGAPRLLLIATKR